MKLKKIKKWAIITYFSLLIILGSSVPIYIYHKSEKLKEQSYNALDSFFRKQYKYTYIQDRGDITFSSKEEKKIFIPFNPELSISPIDNTPKKKEEWKKNYEDLYALYSLGDESCYHKEGKTESFYPLYPCCFSWCLHNIQRIKGGYIQYIIYPYRIGIKKQADEYLYDYMPTSPIILENTFNFYTTNQKSGYSQYYTGVGDKKEEIDSLVENEYYRIERDTISTVFFLGEDGRNYGRTRIPIDDGFIYTDYYKVFMRKSQPITFRITKYKDIEQDRIKRILTTWGIRLTILFLIIYLLIFIRERRLNALAKEPLRSKLLKLCNPSQFMKPYNKEKVEKANSIYKELIDTNENDSDKLKNIRNRALQELEINLLDRNKVEMLKEKANPKNFMKPYQPNKIEKANELYDKLSLGDLDIDVIEEIEQKIKELYQ
ncbi:hypothetical protein [Capnocytophaga sp. oral taxon 324]|uniref:hypothetical protein n=1 Tax=Capnocytophaga sp. oral taxon 324 TaxID=712211 RepID=UPI0002A40E3B|nr:hypothetical protein [Capnocytophaga sp. oral taxon 324]EKY11441.1 hypothetical protein HMPREF9072_02362 [Capnocytophaga sp. oral taxon 324 str. F0483]